MEIIFQCRNNNYFERGFDIAETACISPNLQHFKDGIIFYATMLQNIQSRLTQDEYYWNEKNEAFDRNYKRFETLLLRFLSFPPSNFSNDIIDLIEGRVDIKGATETNKEYIKKHYTWHTNCKILTDLFA